MSSDLHALSIQRKTGDESLRLDGRPTVFNLLSIVVSWLAVISVYATGKQLAAWLHLSVHPQRPRKRRCHCEGHKHGWQSSKPLALFAPLPEQRLVIAD